MHKQYIYNKINITTMNNTKKDILQSMHEHNDRNKKHDPGT